MREIYEYFNNRFFGNIVLTVFVGMLGLASCTYYTNEFEQVEVLDSISFELNIVPTFEARCNDVGCHNGSIPPDLQRDVAYNNLIFGGYVSDTTNALNNALYEKIDGGSMDVYATDQDRTNIKKWIEDGAQNN